MRTSNQATLKQKPGRDHRTSTRQETLEEYCIADRESCRSVTTKNCETTW